MTPLAGLLWRARWRQQPLQLAVTVLVVALGVALAYAVQLINGSALAEFGQAVRSVNGQPDLVLRGTGSGGFDEQAFVAVAQQAAVLEASPVLEVDTLAIGAQGQRIGVRVIGLDALRVARLSPDLLPRAARDETRLAALDPTAVFLNPAARLALGRPKADGRLVALQTADRQLTWRDAGDVPAAGPPLLVMDLAGAQAGFQRIGRLSRIDLRVLAGTDPAALLAALPGHAALRLARPDEATARASQLSLSYRVNLTVLALVALFTGGFLVYSVQSLAVARQVPQLALLGVLGLDARGRRRLVLTEAAGLGLLGSAAGLVLGAWLAQFALNRLGADLGSGQLGSGGSVLGAAPRLHWEAGTALLYGTLGLAAAMAGAWWPARTAERLAPAQALKGLGIDAGHRPSRWRGPVLIGLGIALAYLPAWHGLPLAAYAAVAALLLGGLATIPALLGAVLARLPDTRAPVLHLALARAREARHEATASIAGVVASLALAVALTVMVGSFRDSVAAWLDQLLPADLYVRSSRQASDVVWLPPALAAEAAALPGVRRVQGQRTLSIPIDPARPAPTLIVRPLPADVATALPLVGPRVANPGPLPSAYASEAMASLYGASPGRPFTFTWPDGQRRSVWIAGLWRDYARQYGALMLDEADWLRLGGALPVNELALWLVPGTSPAAVEATLRQRAGPQAALEFASSGEIRRQSLAIFDRSFAVTRWLQGVAIGIGLVGLASSLSGQVLARRKEFGTLQHLGWTRRQLRRLVVGEALVWTGAGTVLGIALGLAVATVLIRVVNPQSFHWTMDMSVPAGALAVLAAAVLGLAALTAAWSGRLAASRELALSVKEET